MMLSDHSISESAMSSYLQLLLSSEAQEFVLYISDSSHYTVYITVDKNMVLYR